MEHKDRNKPDTGLKPADILLILYRRKWLILFFTLTGIVAAGVFYKQAPAVYSSKAKLFIRYVLEDRLPAGMAAEASISQPDSGGKNIIASEVEVLTSYDLALEVAEKVGASKILRGNPQPTTGAAARVVAGGIIIDTPKHSNVLRLEFHHSDPTIVQPVLQQIITSYLAKHHEIHRTSGLFDEVLTQQTDALRMDVARTEEELRKLKVENGISSIEDAKRVCMDELSRVRQQINETVAQMAEHQAALASMRESIVSPGVSSTNDTAIVAEVPPEVVTEYTLLQRRLESLRQQELNLGMRYTQRNELLQSIQTQIAESAKNKSAMETEYPGLLGPGVASLTGNGPQNFSSSFDAVRENARMAALKAKLETLQKLHDDSVAQLRVIQDVEPKFLRLQREKEMDEAKYRQFQASLEQARFDENLGAGRLSNISVAQNPSPASREAQELIRTVGMILAGGLGLGLMLAFLLEMYLKPTIKTASEIERRFRTEVFLSIPTLGRNGHSSANRALLAANASGDGAASETGTSSDPSMQLVKYDPTSQLQVYYEGLRDRIMTWFDIRNVRKKPKLVAVTSCEHGAGVSSIAAGLAATFSETGDGRVLLVDMNVGQGAAHSFYKGQPGLGLDDALEAEKRDSAQVNENLFVATEGASNHDKLPNVLPRRFTALVPKLKASDFDYIIFDMPPVSPITITPRLSAYMDMVLMVVAADKTSPQQLRQASELLGHSKANVAAVLNKTKASTPKWIEG